MGCESRIFFRNLLKYSKYDRKQCRKSNWFSTHLSQRWSDQCFHIEINFFSRNVEFTLIFSVKNQPSGTIPWWDIFLTGCYIILKVNRMIENSSAPSFSKADWYCGRGALHTAQPPWLWPALNVSYMRRRDVSNLSARRQDPLVSCN